MLSSCILAARNSDIQEEVYNELVSVFGDYSEFKLSGNSMSKLHKFRAFIHEALRIFSPAPVAGFRMTKNKNIKTKDSNINNKVYNIPKNTLLIMNVSGIHHNRKYWKLPNGNTLDNDSEMDNINLKFWLNNDGKFDKKRNSNSFFAFSFGKRDCVGQSLAMKQIYMVMGLLLMKYKVIESPKTKGKTFTERVGQGGVSIPYPNEFRLQER